MDAIRPYDPADEEAVAAVWYRAGRAGYTYLPNWQALTPEVAREVFREVIAARGALWVGTVDERIVAYLAMQGSLLDRLYVDPAAQRQGWGRRLVRYAKALQPSGLELFTHQQNHTARALYEAEAFVAVRFGLSPAPEFAPDVEYHWRP